MKAISQLKQYGFTITPELERIIKTLPADTFNQLEVVVGEHRRAIIWCDKENKTDIVITQKV